MLRWALFVTNTIIQSITSSVMCSLHLTHPSAHTLGAVGSWHCGARGAVGGSGLTSVMDNSCRSRDSNPQPRVTSPTLYTLGHNCPLKVYMRTRKMNRCTPKVMGDTNVFYSFELELCVSFKFLVVIYFCLLRAGQVLPPYGHSN